MKARLYEREAVVAAVRRLLDAALAGRGGTVFVAAPAGLGKTSVLQMAVAEAGGRFDIRAGSGDAVEASLPYGLIAQVLGGEGELATPDVAGDLSAANRFYDALRRIRRAAADRPQLLALDDLHWADPDSLAFLHLLCRRAPALPLAIVATARPWPDPALHAAEQLAARGIAAALLDRVLTRPGLPEPTRLSAQLLLGRAAFHTGAVQRAGELFDTVAEASGHSDPELALKTLLDHTLQSWARLGPGAALPVAARARSLAGGVPRYQQACAEAAWALCAWLSGDPAGLSAAERAPDTRSLAPDMDQRVERVVMPVRSRGGAPSPVPRRGRARGRRSRYR